MEQFIIQHPVPTLIIWTVLNLLHYYLNFLNSRLYKSLADFDPKFEIKYDQKSFWKLLLWIGFGIGMLCAYRQLILQKPEKTDEYFVFAGALFFLVIGYLLKDILSLGKYFVYCREISKITYPSFKATMILISFEFFGYSILMFLSFLISKSPFLLGGAIGLAFGGALCILELTRKKYSSKIEDDPKSGTNRE